MRELVFHLNSISIKCMRCKKIQIILHPIRKIQKGLVINYFRSCGVRNVSYGDLYQFDPYMLPCYFKTGPDPTFATDSFKRI